MPAAPDNQDAQDYAERLRERFAEALAGTAGSDGLEQPPPWLVSVASAGNTSVACRMRYARFKRHIWPANTYAYPSQIVAS
jgi:hypothetical protein